MAFAWRAPLRCTTYSLTFRGGDRALVLPRVFAMRDNIHQSQAFKFQQRSTRK